MRRTRGVMAWTTRHETQCAAPGPSPVTPSFFVGLRPNEDEWLTNSTVFSDGSNENLAPCTHDSMSKMAYSGRQAGDASLLAEVKGVLIALGPAGVDQDLHARVDEELRPIGEGEEGVGEGDRSPGT